MKRSPLVCLLLASIASPAFADDLTVDSVLTSPIFTSHASNGTAGNITISSIGGISVVTSGAALTLDSNNTVENIGVIQNALAGGATGVHIVGGNTGSFSADVTYSSIINVGSGGAGNFGIVLDGSSAFNGNILLGNSSVLVVQGSDSAGIAIMGPLNGNLTVGSTTTVTGERADGVLVLAPVTGEVSLTYGVIAGGTKAYTVDSIDPLSGSALAVGSNVGGGILNAGSASAADATTASSLTSSGTAPTLAIQPSIAGPNASDITIGALASDAVNPTYSLINRGTIRATENDPGISTIAVGIGELGTATHTVTLQGGIYNRGQITAQAESDNQFAFNSAAAPANATGILIGNGATVNAAGLAAVALLNEGSVIVSETGNLSGTATGVLIQPGAVLPSFTNSGTVNSFAITSDTTISSLAAYGVRDLSGTLTAVVNSGIMSVQATTLDNNAQTTVAADLSHSSANETFVDSGSVAGDILFGSGANVLSIEGANGYNTCSAACVQGAVRATGNGTLDVVISPGGTGGALRTSNAQLRTLTVGNAGALELAIGKNSTTAPVVTASGATTFNAGSKVTIVPATFLPNSGTYTLVHSAGALTFADFASTTAQPIPYIFDGTITRQNNDLVLTLQRKTAAELGLTGTQAAIYEPLASAALNDDRFGAGLLSLGSAADVAAVVTSVVPDIAGGVRALGIAMTDQATGVVGARERSLVTAPPNTRDEFRFWGQEFYNSVSADGSAATPGYNGAGQGVAMGVEWGDLATGRYGLGYTFFSSQEVETHPRDTKTNGDWNMLSFYGGWRTGDLFVTPQVNAGLGSLISRRGIGTGTLARTASAKWTGYLAAGGLTTGYIFDVSGFQIIPELSLDGLYLGESAYQETGAGGVGLSLKQQSQQSVRSFAGVLGQANYSWETGTLQPQLLVGWSHEFSNSPATIDGTFESTPGSPFHLVGPTLEPNKLIGGASFAYVLGNWSAGVNYDASASMGTLAQSATVNLSSRF